MKKLLTMLLLVLVCVLAFSACNGNTNDTSIPSESRADQSDRSQSGESQSGESQSGESQSGESQSGESQSTELQCVHSWKEATCLLPKTCSKCGETSGSALGHDIVDIPEKIATCTQSGYTGGKMCSRCETVTVEPTSIPVKAHTYVDGVCKDCGSAFIAGPNIYEKFDGREINFFVSGGEGSTQVRSIALGEKDDPAYVVNMAIANRNKMVENELDVKIVVKETCHFQEAVSYLTPILCSKMYAYDVIALYQCFDLGLALGDTVGSFYNYCNMPKSYTNYLNLTAPYWSQSMMEVLKLNDVLFEITGDMNLTYTDTMFVSYVNERLWASYAEEIANLPNNPEHYTSAYDLVRNGYWTMDLWMDLSKMAWVDNGDGKVTVDDQVGLLTYNSTAYLNNIQTDMFAAGAHVNYSVLDADGRPVMAFNSERNMLFAQKLYQLLCESNAGAFGWQLEEGASDEDNPYITEFFARGNALMTVHTLQRAEYDLADMRDNFYVLPLPMLDRIQFDPESPSLGYSTQLGDSVSHYAICRAIGDENIPCVTATLELMAYYSMRDVTPAFYGVALRNTDDESKEMIQLSKEGIYSDFATVWTNQLSKPTWYFRYSYDKSGEIARNLREQNNQMKSSYRTLYQKILEAYWVD